MNLTMKDKDFNPLIGRTGVDVGKSFSGKDWKVTARAGLGYQFDLFANGETVLRDASGEKRIKGEKDGRMLMNVGLNAEIRDNLRFGLEFEKSAFGKYNVDNAINCQLPLLFLITARACVCGPSSTGENMYYPVTDYIALALIISFLFLTLFICLLCLKHERIKKETIRQKNAHILDHGWNATEVA